VPRSRGAVGRCRGGSRAALGLQRAVAASPRIVSQPKASGSRLSGRKRIGCMNSPNSVGESLPLSTSVLPVRPGGKLSNASQETSTIRLTRVAPSQASSWTSAPPVSLPMSVTSFRSRRSRSSETSRASPRGDRSASARIAWRCAPTGSVGATQRCSGDSSAITCSHSEASIMRPGSSTIVGPSPPVSSYSIVPADSSIRLVIARSPASRRAGAGAGRTAVRRRRGRGHP
jgi:hypothetical protein